MHPTISFQNLLQHYNAYDSKTNRNLAAAALLSLVTGLALAIFAATSIYCHKMKLPFFHKSIRNLTTTSCAMLPVVAILWLGITSLGRKQAKKRSQIIKEFKKIFCSMDEKNRSERCLKELFLPTHNKHYKRELISQVIQTFPKKETLEKDNSKIKIIEDLEAAKNKLTTPTSKERTGGPKMEIGKLNDPDITR